MGTYPRHIALDRLRGRESVPLREGGLGGFNSIAGEFPGNVTFPAGYGLHRSDFWCRCGLILEKNIQYRPQQDEG